MAFLRDEIRQQKMLEAGVDVDKFLRDLTISETSMIYEIQLSKEVFKLEAEARDWLNSHSQWSAAITDGGTVWRAGALSTAQVDLDTQVEITLRRGIVVKAADLRPSVPMGNYAFNNVDMSEKGAVIALAEGLPYIIEIARVAEGTHATYGALKITAKDLESFERNFNLKITGVDLAVNEDHKKNEAFGWFKSVFRSQDQERLYGEVSWNAKGITALSDKLYRYFSPEFRFNYVHPHTGTEHGPTLMGGALTNYPFLKMDAITELNQKQENEMADKDTVSLSEHNTKVLDLTNKLRDTEVALSTNTKVLEGLRASNTELSDKVKSMEEAQEKAAKEVKNTKLFSENKINAAQLVALNEGKSFEDVLALGTKLNTTAKGGGPVEDVELSEGDLRAMKNAGVTKEEYIAANKLSK